MTVSRPAACVLVFLGLLIGSRAGDAQGPAHADVATPGAHPVYPGGDATPLGARVAMLLKDPAAVCAHWGIAVTAMDGTPLYGLEEEKLFRPASTAKLFTTAAAMALLGPESRVHTGLYALRTPGGQGSVQDGVLDGDLLLAGAGDASFGTNDVPYRAPVEHGGAGPATTPAAEPDPLQAITAALVRLRLTHITGDIIGDDSRWPSDPVPESWSVGDMLAGYGAPVSALSLHDNVVTVQVTPGAAAGASSVATTVPSVGAYTVELHTDVTGQAAAFHLSRVPGSHVIAASGTPPSTHPFSADVPVDDPALFAAETIKAALQGQGVQVDGEARAKHQPAREEDPVADARKAIAGLPLRSSAVVDSLLPPCVDGCTVLAGWASPTLAEDVAATMKESINLHAEVMLRRLGEAFADGGTTAQGARVERQWLRKIDVDESDFVFVDGSGLSDHDLVTPRAEAQLLGFAATQDWFASWKASLPIGGRDGTLTHRFLKAPLQGHVFAKTGTLGESRALAGYVQCASGREVIVAILVDNHLPENAADRTVMDNIVAAIAELE